MSKNRIIETKNDGKPTEKSGRQVFRLSPSLKFSEKKKRPRLFFNLRTQLIITFLVLVMIPISLITYIFNKNAESALKQTVSQALTSAATQTAIETDDFLRAHLDTLKKHADAPEIKDYLALPIESQPGSSQESIANNFLKAQEQIEFITNPFLQAYLLLDRKGKILLDTLYPNPESNTPFLGLDKADVNSFLRLLQSGEPYVSSVIFAPEYTQPNLYFVARVSDENQKPLGFLLSRYDATVLQTLLVNRNGLVGQGSFAVLFDENHLRIAQGIYPEMIYKTVTPLNQEKLNELQANFRFPTTFEGKSYSNLPILSQMLDSYASGKVNITAPAVDGNQELYAGSLVQLGLKPWLLAFMQPQNNYLAPIREQLVNTLWLEGIITLVVILIAILISRLLTNPIKHLTQVAERVTSGDLTALASPGPGEFGFLADAFNSMTIELRRTLDSLEQRIHERTSELAHASEQMQRRANRLQAVAEVAHAITSVQEMDRLLQLVTYLISERFEFYHVGIFLLDQTGEYAILQAANSEGGQRMLAKGHRLKVGEEGIVGYAMGAGEPRIALDVGSDSVYFDNPDLPLTRSEMTLPLKVGGKIIGALDVQSTQPTAFTEEDVATLSTLADQVAIAIQNTRLFSETNKALKELETLHTQYLQQAWSQVVEERSKSGYQYRNGKVIPLPLESSDVIWQQVKAGIPVVVSSPLDDIGIEMSPGSALLVPISVRSQVIGALHLPSPEDKYLWDEQNINLVKEVADQIGLALENARLLEQTQIRAEREHLVADITTKLRASNNPQEIIQTAARELSQALRAKQARFVAKAPSSSTEFSNLKPSKGNGNGSDAKPDLNINPEP